MAEQCVDRRWLGFIKCRTYVTVPELVVILAGCTIIGAWTLSVRSAYEGHEVDRQALLKVTEQLDEERESRATRDAELEATFSRLHIQPLREAGALAQPLTDSFGRLTWTGERVDNIVSQLVRDEGIVLKPYRVGNDPKNPLLIGAGHSLNAHGISEAAARFILREDLEDVRRQLQPYGWYARADAVRRGALENIAYADGTGGLVHLDGVVDAAAAGDWKQAADRLGATSWCVATGPRCVRIRKQLEDDLWH